MKERLDPHTASPKAIKAMLKLEDYTHHCGLEHALVELVKIRASQINGCAYCLDMHTRDARSAGESEQRLYVLSAWTESPLYSERERAALAWTEALTRIADSGVPDAVYNQAREHFSEEELVNLSLLVGGINIWNRLAVAFHRQHPMEPAGLGAVG
ncbi:carboxymuconolactone decarboxylase family protein [Parahaliea mediterranea]|uniref:Carboxymuconolactone decarboxylase family protein n=1 Tax=Parahaliea mediterranea TaxID=651086 RepID=A0A939IML6_9GAMM|nr:carboxymuconolactone decarboxylase family protein [Parahaliea mediterranea]MBN7797655.1 carboxymuconolactone decarboxylase family protein [Parahaliea mediterranea]